MGVSGGPIDEKPGSAEKPSLIASVSLFDDYDDTLKAGSTLTSEALIEYVASNIARYKKPKQVVFVDALPKTAEGEIDRDQLKKDHGNKC